MKNTRPRARYDLRRLTDDMAAKGWMMFDLAREAGVHNVTVTRFFRAKNPVQTPKTAKKLSRALGRSPGYYLIRNEKTVAA